MAITELDPGGAEKAFVRIACGLQQCGWQVTVISLRDRGVLADTLEQAGIPVQALDCGGSADLRCLPRLLRQLKRIQPSVLLTFLHQANIAGRLAGRRARVPVIVSGIRVADRRWAVILPERLTAGCVDAWIAVSQSVADTHARLCHLPKDRMAVIGNGIDAAQIAAVPPADRGQWELSERQQIILCAGRLVPQKAPSDLLEAFARLPESVRHESRLLYVGDGPLWQTLLEQARHLQVADAVLLAGWRSDVISLMKMADVLVLPSRWEGLPNVILEAMAAGLPVIASAVDGVVDVLPATSQEWLFPPGDIDALKERLERFLNADKAIRATASESQAVVVKDFTWDSVIAKYDQLLHRLLEQKSPDGPRTR